MTSRMNERCAREFRRLSKEMVLCLAGIFAVHSVDDEVVWESARAIHQVIERSAARLSTTEEGSRAPETNRRLRPHPAMEELLRLIDAELDEEVAS